MLGGSTSLRCSREKIAMISPANDPACGPFKVRSVLFVIIEVLGR